MAKFRTKLNDILVSVSWGDLSREYFGKPSSWLHHKLDAVEGSGDGSTEEERQQFKGALCDLAERIRRVADTI